MKTVLGENLKKGASSNCGCLRKHASKHGCSPRAGKTRTYRIWKNMRSRCREAYVDRKNYFDKGISVCEEWNNFSRFLEDMGEAPDGLTLDRIDNNKGYNAQNCRWASMLQQRLNQSRLTMVELDGVLLPVAHAAKQIGVTPAAVWQAIKRGAGSPQDAIDNIRMRRA